MWSKAQGGLVDKNKQMHAIASQADITTLRNKGIEKLNKFR